MNAAIAIALVAVIVLFVAVFDAIRKVQIEIDQRAIIVSCVLAITAVHIAIVSLIS